jgi:hypothetical protein
MLMSPLNWELPNTSIELSRKPIAFKICDSDLSQIFCRNVNKDETRMTERVYVQEVSQKEECLGVSALQKLVSCCSTGINMVKFQQYCVLAIMLLFFCQCVHNLDKKYS